MKRSNEAQFSKARKMLPDFDKASGSNANLDGTKMDKAGPKALRLANGGASRQPRNGGMKFVKRDMGGMIGEPHLDGVEEMTGVRNNPVLGIGAGQPGGKFGGAEPMMKNPPALGIGAGQPGGRFNRPGMGGVQGTLDPGQTGAGKMFGQRPLRPAVMPPPEPMPMPPVDPMMGGDAGGGGFKRGGAIKRASGGKAAFPFPRGKAGRHSTKEDAADKKADAFSAKKVGKTPAAFEGTKADKRMDSAGARPFKTGGAPQPIKRAMGGVGKVRHLAATPEGKPKAAPKGKSTYEVI